MNIMIAFKSFENIQVLLLITTFEPNHIRSMVAVFWSISSKQI